MNLLFSIFCMADQFLSLNRLRWFEWRKKWRYRRRLSAVRTCICLRDDDLKIFRFLGMSNAIISSLSFTLCVPLVASITERVDRERKKICLKYITCFCQSGCLSVSEGKFPKNDPYLLQQPITITIHLQSINPVLSTISRDIQTTLQNTDIAGIIPVSFCSMT